MSYIIDNGAIIPLILPSRYIRALYSERQMKAQEAIIIEYFFQQGKHIQLT
jgi:hypothetical protein